MHAEQKCSCICKFTVVQALVTEVEFCTRLLLLCTKIYYLWHYVHRWWIYHVTAMIPLYDFLFFLRV